MHERRLREVELARFGDDLAAQLSRTDAMVTQFGHELADVLASAGSSVETWLDSLHGGLEQVHAGLAHGHALAQTSNLLAETNIRLVQGSNEQLVMLEGRSKQVAASLDQSLAIATEHQTKLQVSSPLPLRSIGSSKGSADLSWQAGDIGRVRHPACRTAPQDCDQRLRDGPEGARAQQRLAGLA